MILIGSAAYKNKYRDIDLLCTKEEVEKLDLPKYQDPIDNDISTIYPLNYNDKIIEAIIPKENSWLQLVVGKNKTTIDGLEVDLPSLDTILDIKKAHLILPIKWEHHIKEYELLKRLVNKEIHETNSKLFIEARKFAKSKQKTPPKLNVAKDEFFTSNVQYVFDHDSIHLAVAYPMRPAYESITSGEVMADKNKWNALTYDEKLRCVIEEASVLALERAIIPHFYLGKGFNGVGWSYKHALFKVCTTITSGWFREFAIENYGRALSRMPNLANILCDGLEKGVIKWI